MILQYILAGLAVLGLLLMLWQWVAARRFPLHRRVADKSFTPAVTVFKPMKGADEFTESCLRSWFTQEYAGPVEILFGMAQADDPAAGVVKKLMAEFPQRDARLVITSERLGTNGKVSNLAQLEPLAKHQVLVVSDADVLVPPDFLANGVAPLRDVQVGVVNCFYRLANPSTLAMQWEAIAVNADFWSSVLQSASLKPLDFALGAVMVTRRKQLEEIGGFRSLADCLADDYQLGNRIAKQGHRIELCPVVVECWSGKMGWGAVWRHQLRWARTVRVCQPVPYFFSILANGTVWVVAWWLASLAWCLWRITSTLSESTASVTMMLPGVRVMLAWIIIGAFCLLVRLVMCVDLQSRLANGKGKMAMPPLVWVKDLLQVALWVGAFAGNTVEWRGEKYRMRRDGTLIRKAPNSEIQ